MDNKIFEAAFEYGRSTTVANNNNDIQYTYFSTLSFQSRYLMCSLLCLCSYVSQKINIAIDLQENKTTESSDRMALEMMCLYSNVVLQQCDEIT